MPKAAFAGVTLATSFARLRPSMAMFNVERTPSPGPFVGWDLSVMIKTQGCEAWAVRKSPYKDGRPSSHCASCKWSHSAKGAIEVTVAFEGGRS